MENNQIPDDVFAHYQRLQRFVGWTDADAERVRAAASFVRPAFDALIDDFYGAILSEPETARLITGGHEQVRRLKGTLRQWLEELVAGRYDAAYVQRRWRAGLRHMEIGLRQVYADAALSRLRAGLQKALQKNWPHELDELLPVARSLDRLLDLELAIIEDAYTTQTLVEQRRNIKHQSEVTFRNLVETARCIIVILRQDHTIAYFNPYASQVTGYAVDELLGKDYFPIFLPVEEREGVAQEIQRILAGGAQTLGYENSLVCKSGERRLVLWNAQKLDDYDGAPAVLAVGHDITELKRAQEQVLQSERLAAIGQTVAGLAHESRNAFQRSQACLEMLALELEDRPEEMEMVDRIQRALNHLHHLYEEVRSYAAPIKLDRAPCKLAHVWRSAWSHLDLARRDKHVDLREETCNPDLTCTVDEFALGQVFRNILENAIAACPNPGEIIVRAGPAHLDQRPAIEVSFSDNGPGLSPEAAQRIFEPFFTTKTKGTGLGMAIAQRLVDAHGGRIAVGQRQRGAEIIVTLPRS